MNAAASILIILLTQQGYWLSGQEQTVRLRWAVQQPPAELAGAVVEWRLALGEVVLAEGRAELAAGEPAAMIHLTAPEVRVPVRMSWHWRLVHQKRVLDEDAVPVHVFPNDLLEGLGRRIADRPLLVWDQPQGLPALLEQVQVPFRRIDGSADLNFVDARLVIVGPGQLLPTSGSARGASSGQAQLQALARAGAAVLVLRQPPGQVLFGHPVRRRETPATLRWRAPHPLFAALDAPTLASLAVGVDTDPALWPLELADAAPVIPLLYWPPAAESEDLLPAAALIAIQPVGAGQIIYCQLPLGDWSRDPRSQLLLRGAMDALLGPPPPTPPPPDAKPARPPLTGTIDLLLPGSPP